VSDFFFCLSQRNEENSFAIFEMTVAVLMKIRVFGDIKLLESEDGVASLLRKVGNNSPVDRP
jgi:ABC-type uncharacterized transport system permease subunit